MTAARVIHESYDGGSIEVDVRLLTAVPKVVIEACERGREELNILYLTRAESDELIDALIAANQEIDAAALTQTAPVGAGAAPTAEAAGTSGHPVEAGGQTRTQAGHGGPSAAVSGRPISHHDGPDGVWCKWSGCVSRTGACPEGHELPGYVSTLIGPAGGEL